MSASRRIDRIFPLVGRITRVAGTSHAATFRRVNETLSELSERGRVDILEAVRDGILTPMQVHVAASAGHLDRLPKPDDMLPLSAAFAKWIETYDCSDRHRESLRQTLRYLLHEARKGATVAQLPMVLEKHRARMARDGHARTFNITRSNAQAFARSTRKRHSPLWRDIAAVEPLDAATKRKGHPLTVAAFYTLLDGLPMDQATDARMMALTGMGPKEYYGDGWETYPERVHVFGKKRDGRDRDVPNAISGYVPSEPWGSYRMLREALSDATGGTVQPYDLRRTFANWMESARIPRTRRMAYMGHQAGDVTDRYERHEITDFLEADSRTLRNYIVSATADTPADGPNTNQRVVEVPRSVTHAPSRNRTENLLIKSQGQGVGSTEDDARQHS